MVLNRSMVSSKNNHTLRERMSISQYMTNSLTMIKNWSLDRDETNEKCEKPFQEKPKIEALSWILAYNFFFKDQGEVQYCKKKNLYCM